MEKEKLYNPVSGYFGLILLLVLIGWPVVVVSLTNTAWIIAFIALGILWTPGFLVVNPNESSVLVLFGKYVGTVKKNGFFYVNPFFVKKKISLRARSLRSVRFFVTRPTASVTRIPANESFLISRWLPCPFITKLSNSIPVPYKTSNGNILQIQRAFHCIRLIL